MPNIDPGQLLKALAPLLDKSGGMRDTESATRIVSLMKDTTKLVSKCVYVNIFLHTKSTDVLQKFITNSGWNMLNKWLQEAKDTDNTVFILELLKVYQSLPVSVEDLKKDNTARFIKGLTKHSNEDVQKLSASVVDSWMKKVKGKSNNENDNDKLKKRRKKDKDREKDRDKEREKDRDKEKDKDREKDRDKEREKDRDKEKDKEREKDRDKEKDKEREKDRDKEREKDRDKEKDKDREKERDKEKDKDREKDKEKDKDRHRHKSAEKKDSSHLSSKSHPHHSSKKDSSSNDKKTLGNVSDTVHRERNSSDSREDSSESAEARLAPDSSASKNPSLSKTNSSGKEEEEEKTRRKPKTARVFTNKFRSVFDEDDPLPPIKKKKLDDLKPPLPLTKRNSSELPKEEPAEKIPRLTLKIPLLGADSSAITVSPTSASPPEVTHGRIKIIPPRRPPAHEIHDSNVFMNELTKASYTHGTIKRKKKPALAAIPTSKQPTTGVSARTPLSTAPATPTTPNIPVSPMTATAQKLPSVPSFYRDTLETADGDEEVPAKERSPPPLEKMDTNEPEEMPQDNKMEDNSEPPTIYMETNHKTPTEMETGTALDTSVISEGGEVAIVKEESVEQVSESAEGGEQKGVPTEDGTQVKKNKKRVSWAEEAHLKQVFYFELDETERENVNRPKTFSELKKQDMKSEGKAMESAKRLNCDNMVEILPWRRPPLIDNLNTTVEIGCNSVEKGIQQQRESGVLQALFFSKQMLPDSPAEAELENVEPSDTKIIPLVDETSSAEEYEHTYNVDPANMPYDPGFDITHNLKPANNGVPNNGGSVGPMGGIQLPPDINNMLASIQQQSIATGGQSLQANSAVMANVQNILASIMHGGQGVNSEELISKLRVALEPLKNQIEAPMPIINPNEAQFRPQGQQRHGLLGNAPPGYNPMMGPRSFGPQGPGMGGGMEGDWNNMNMGNMPGPDMGMRGPMGPGFHPMQGPGPGMGGNGPVMPGPRMRNNRRGGPERRSVCRHFVAPSGCRFGNSCAFLHPGVNGPPPPNH